MEASGRNCHAVLTLLGGHTWPRAALQSQPTRTETAEEREEKRQRMLDAAEGRQTEQQNRGVSKAGAQRLQENAARTANSSAPTRYDQIAADWRS